MSSLSKLIKKKAPPSPARANVHAPSWFETRRQLQPAVGTAAELQRQPDQVELLNEPLRALYEESTTSAAIESDPIVIPATIDREGYFDERHLAYWLSGLADLQMVQRLLPDASFKHVLDFGGATGRFARHIVAADSSARVTIAELNINHIEWVQEHFSPSVRAVKVSPYPYFPLADGSVTLCVGLSVFTHIDCYETGWLAEISRVLAVGGYALLTVHTEETWRVLPNRDSYKYIKDNIGFRETYRYGEPMPAQRLVFAFNEDSIEHNCNVFVDTNYIRRRWSSWFDVLDVVHNAHHDVQAAVLLRKRQD